MSRSSTMHNTAMRILIMLLFTLMSAAPFADQRYVFIGDSLVDNQNSYIATTLVTPSEVIPASPPYFDGRFSNGLNWTDRLAPEQLYYMDYYFSNAECATTNSSTGLASLCGSTVDPGAQPGVSLSFAFGGSEAGTALLPSAPGMLSVLNDLSNYNDSGVVADLEGATFAMLTGGNDYTNYVLTGGGGVSEQAIVAQTLGNIETGLEMASQMGAGRAIVLNLFDLQRVPSLSNYFDSTQLIQSGRLSNLHNAGLVSSLNDAEQSTGLDIVLVDLYALYEDIFAHPDRYGFSNTTSGCITSDASHAATGECPDAASEKATLFWDGQHPTEQAHDYIYQLVNATVGAVDEDGGRLASLADAALLQLRSANSTIRNHLNNDRIGIQPHSSAKQKEGDKSLFVEVAGGSGSRNTQADFAGYDYRIGSVVAGIANKLESNIETMQVGSYLGYYSLDADINGGGSFDNKSLGIGVFANGQQHDISLGIQTTLIRFDVTDIKRITRFSVLPVAEGTTSGWGISLESQATLHHLFEHDDALPGGLALSGRLAVSRALLDDYNEDKAEFLNLSVEQSDLTELFAGIELAIWQDFSTSSGRLQTGLSLGYERDLLNQERETKASLSSGESVDSSSSLASHGQINLRGSVQLIRDNHFKIGLLLDSTFDDRNHNRQFIPRITFVKTL